MGEISRVHDVDSVVWLLSTVKRAEGAKRSTNAPLQEKTSPGVSWRTDCNCYGDWH